MTAPDRRPVRPTTLLGALYPEVAAGGFSRVDGTVGFYSRVNALLETLGPEAVVLDYGAGRGAFVEDPVPFRRALRTLRGKAARVIGTDVDPAVLTNPAVDEAHVIAPGIPLPLDDSSVDLIVSDFTFEHVAEPRWAADELDRVLRAGGWLCARTPNRWGYIAIGARLVPNRRHVAFLRWLQPAKKAADTFPTVYRMNTLKDLRRWFPLDHWDHFAFAADSEPTYVAHSVALARLNQLLFRLTPPASRSMLHVFFQKREVKSTRNERGGRAGHHGSDGLADPTMPPYTPPESRSAAC